MADSDSPLRTTIVMPVRGNSETPLPHTPTQKEMANVVSRSVRPSVQRARGCAWRALLEGTPLVEFGERAVIELCARLQLQHGSRDILDLGLDDGQLWEKLLARLGKDGRREPLRLTALRAPTSESEERGTRETHLRLVAAAAAHGIPAQLHLDAMTPAAWPGEFVPSGGDLIVSAVFALHHIPDDGFGSDSMRTLVLRRLRRLRPSFVVCCEPDFGPFAERRIPRLGDAPSPAEPVTEAIEALRRAYDPALADVPVTPGVASDDDRTPPPLILRGTPVPSARPEMPDRMENWHRRFQRAGFAPIDLTPLRGALVGGLKLPARAVVAPDRESLRLTWDGKPLVAVSAWRPVQ